MLIGSMPIGSNSLLGMALAAAPFVAIAVLFYFQQRRLASTPALAQEETSITAPDWPRIINRDEHHISRRDLSDSALKVMYRLKDAGYEAYLVGGCVRDTLLDLHPKDFDIATDAHPEEVHELFRNSRLIGRRFKLVHVRFGREIIEVATFRASHDSPSGGNEQHGRQSEEGMILRDNVYGDIEDDALRRDFTVNALYYNIRDFAVYDYADGIRDLENRQLRLIGDPEERYREDPVRMLRAIRFAAKLQFNIEPTSERPIRELAGLLQAVPAARLFEEILKLLLSGQGEVTYRLLRHYNLFEHLFPATAALLDQQARTPEQCPPVEELLIHALRNTDDRIREDKSVTPSFFFAALLWHPLCQRMAELEAEGVPTMPALQQAAQEVITQQNRHTSIPRRYGIPTREIWELQLRLPHRQGARATQLLEHPRFRAAYDFLLLREASGEELGGLGDWWTRYQTVDGESRDEMASELPAPSRARKKRRRRPRKRNPKPQHG